MHALHAQRGVAMVEFLVVLMPLLLLFLCTLELARFSIASLMLKRSAGVAARACAVIKNQPLHCDNNQDDRTGQDPGQDANIQAAAVAALLPFKPEQLRVDSATCSVGADPTPESGTDAVRVSARLTCVFPLARDILCQATPPSSAVGPAGCGVTGACSGAPTRVLSASAKFGHQGARYDCWYSREIRLGLPGVGASDPVQNPEFF